MSAPDLELLLLALLAVVTLVTLVTRLKVNPFVALLLASLVVGLGAVSLGTLVTDGSGKRTAYTMAAVMKSFSDGTGATLGGIVAVIGLGTMLGKLLAESGGAQVLAQRFATVFGATRAHWWVMLLALVVGLTTWFAVGLVLLIPIVSTLSKETKQPFLRLAIPMLSCLSVMHGLMPPHPGPVVAVSALGAPMGLVLFWGLVVGVPTALVAGPLFARHAVAATGFVAAPALVRAAPPPGARAPGFSLTLFSILLPVGLMLLATLAELTLAPGGRLRAAATLMGNPTLALLIAVLFAAWSLGFNCGYGRTQLLAFTEDCIAAMGMTLLIVGGSGGFARVLRDAGVADAIGRAGDAWHVPPLIYGWLLAAFIRVATGSATVAITTASALLVPVLAAHPELTRNQIALVVVALGSGSLFLSHLNDSGFWIVKDFLGLTLRQTLRTWTVCEVIIGVVGLALSAAAFFAVGT